MTESEAVSCLRASPRSRRRNMLGVALSGALFASLTTLLLFVWLFDESLESAAIRAVTWLVLGGLVGWWIAAADDLAKVAATVEAAVPAQVAKVDGQRITVREDNGTELVWAVQSPRKLRVEVGQALWLSSPARRGEHVLAVMDSDSGDRKTPTVLWPAEVAWTPGRWD